MSGSEDVSCRALAGALAGRARVCVLGESARLGVAGAEEWTHSGRSCLDMGRSSRVSSRRGSFLPRRPGSTPRWPLASESQTHRADTSSRLERRREPPIHATRPPGSSALAFARAGGWLAAENDVEAPAASPVAVNWGLVLVSPSPASLPPAHQLHLRELPSPLFHCSLSTPPRGACAPFHQPRHHSPTTRLDDSPCRSAWMPATKKRRLTDGLLPRGEPWTPPR